VKKLERQVILTQMASQVDSLSNQINVLSGQVAQITGKTVGIKQKKRVIPKSEQAGGWIAAGIVALSAFFGAATLAATGSQKKEFYTAAQTKILHELVNNE